MFPSLATRSARQLARERERERGRLGAMVAPGALSLPSPLPPGAFSPVPSLLVGDRHFSRWRPRWIACAPGGSEMRNLAGRAGERRGVPYREIWWDSLTPASLPGLCWSPGPALFLVSFRLLPRTKAGGSRRAWGFAFGFAPGVPSHETARCYTTEAHRTKVSWPVFRRNPPASHANKGRRVSLTSGFWLVGQLPIGISDAGK